MEKEFLHHLDGAGDIPVLKFRPSKGIDMDLVEASGRLPVRLKEPIRVVRVAEDVSSRAVIGNKLVLNMAEFLGQFGVSG